MADTTPPVSEGEELHLEIQDIGEEGDGIAYVEGFVVFVPDTEMGETVDIEIEAIEGSFATATVLERYED